MGIQGLANWLGQISPQLKLLKSRTSRFLKDHNRYHIDKVLKLKNKWKLAIVKWKYTRSPKQRLGMPKANIIIVSDASKTGWGFLINRTPYRGEFDTSMTSSREFSSNMEELITIWFGYPSTRPIFIPT